MLPRAAFFECNKAFFEASLESHCRQLSFFKNSVVKQGNNDLVFASLKMLHILTQRKRPYTEFEFLILPCLEMPLIFCMEEKSR